MITSQNQHNILHQTIRIEILCKIGKL